MLKRNNRPLLEKDPEGVMRQLMETRYPIYANADITVESRDLPHDAIVGEIIDGLGRHAPGRAGRTRLRPPCRRGEADHNGGLTDAAPKLDARTARRTAPGARAVRSCRCALGEPLL